MDKDKNTQTPELDSSSTNPPDNNQSYGKYIDPEYQKKQQKRKMLLVAAIAGAAAIVVAAAILVALTLGSNSGEDNNIAEPVEVTEACEDKECFEQNFSLCQPAKYTATEQEGTTEYEITGIKEVGCLVSLTYLTSDNKDLIGKEMTCDFDNEVVFDESLSLVKTYMDDYECEGELKEYL